MSGVTYGHPGANGGEYVFVAPNGQQMAYAQPGQGVGIPGAMPPQLVQQQSAGTYMTTGGPSMRKTVEGIPQIHVQQQLAQQQQQQQHTVQQTPSMVGGGVPMATAHSVPLLQHHFPVQTGPPAQAYPPGVGVPLEYYQTALHPQQTVGFPHLTATHVPDFRFGGPQYVVESNWHGEGEWDGEYEENGGAVLYGNLEVKHRRRTTPEQLRVLEHYFSINPRPDNQLREFLAGELGITKRNVQVWFQNRRAKIKNQEKAREAAAQEAKNKEAAAAAAAVTANSSDSTAGTKTEPATPEEWPKPRFYPVSKRAVDTDPPNIILCVDKVAMGRRVSLAGGDVASIETWARQRRQQLATTLNTSSSASPANSPMGMAAAARRSSQPYPTQIITHHEDIVTPSRSALPSPKVSPNGRMPQQLLLTAMRNNTMRRASMPGGAQLISVTTFTPPRTINTHPVGSNSTPLRTSGAGVGVFVTPPGIDQSLLNMQHDSQLQYQLNPSDMPFSPNSPLPNPGFTFGGTPSGPINNDNSVYTSMSTTPVLSNSTVDPNHALFMALQRGRLASLASVHSVASNATDATSTCDGSDGDWAPLNPPGFDPDLRRASAPADLLHNIGLLGISSAGSQAMSQVSSANSTQSMTMRPSPLASYNQGYDQQHMQMTSSTPTLGGGPYIPTHETSPSTVTGSNAPSEGPSPSALHSHTTMFGGPTLMPPPPLPQRQTYTTLPQFELEAVPDLPEPSAYTLPSEGNDSLSDFDLGFDFSSDDKDQFSFLADLSGGDDPINVIV
ncbi:uncharacterized protein CcaverHIS019_0607240 [Cutaneotrichosporon cavernicola]|uniref:Homeobox domain-containing protein n=1 Tax=Cutaneotrichosporon cavernicola TaxID=279322 RepID=A0AA48L9A2_9TREE|nr:uncharacterized protein CcaverHIS019_0607240 [Cutaneotrichosporon cavernicola]BEI94265.1 hypothetical protein CcaverHIS019_0607240 [Cutaneotrichosporon cavernicola]